MTDREPLRTNSAARLGRGEQENNYCLTNYCCRRESRSFVSTCPNLHKRVSNLKGGILRVIPLLLPSIFCSIYLRHNRRTNYRKKKIRSIHVRHDIDEYFIFLSIFHSTRFEYNACIYNNSGIQQLIKTQDEKANCCFVSPRFSCLLARRYNERKAVNS